MKYQKVRNLIIGFVFSVSAMTACGVYGGMETEEVEVYGSFEDMNDTEQSSSFWAAADDRSDIDVDLSDAAETFEYHGLRFTLPSSVNQVEEGEDGSVTFETAADGETEPSYIVFQYISFKEAVEEEEAADLDIYDKIIEYTGYVAEDKNDEETENIKGSGADEESVITDCLTYDIFDFDGNTYDIFRVLTNSPDELSQWYWAMIPMDDGDHFVLVKLVEKSGSTYLYENEFRIILENVEKE